VKSQVSRYLANISIRRKLMALIMATCCVILLATTVVFVIKETSSLLHEQRNNLSSLAGILGKNVTAALTFNDPQSALETMSSLSAKSDILAAYILKTDATVFSRYLAQGVSPNTLPFKQLGPDATPDTCKHLLQQISADNNRLLPLSDKVSLVSPILLDNQIIGSVVGIPMNPTG
jgi:hypothetical protein